MPIAERSNPMRRSPSRCPDTARSSTSAGAVTDECFGRDVRPGLASRTFTRGTRRTPSAQAPHQLTFQCATTFDVEGLVVGLVADAHGLIIGEVQSDAVGDLPRTPRLHPCPVLAVRFPVAGKSWGPRTGDYRSVGSANLTRQPFLDVVMKTWGSRPAWQPWDVSPRDRPDA